MKNLLNEKKNVELGEKKKKKNPNCLTTSNLSKRSVSQYIANNFSTLSCKTNEKTRSNEKKRTLGCRKDTV